MRTSQVQLVSTLEHLGDATSRNLEFSYRPDVPISYGEETITESNLLELRGRHSDVIYLRTFSKHDESKAGSDWEWYIVGRRRTLKIRVQAKRVQSNNVLKIPYMVARTGRQQRKLLIEMARADRMRPMYCIYSAESQRSLWSQRGSLQTGCLLADARKLPLYTGSLSSIEWACWPWHYLFEAFPPSIVKDDHLDSVENAGGTSPLLPLRPLPWDAPTIVDLNEDTGRQYDITGVEATTPFDLAMVNVDGGAEVALTPAQYEELRVDKVVRGMVAADVRLLDP